MIKKIILFITLVGIISCEDLITPDLPTNDPILVVDAWINNLEKNVQALNINKLPEQHSQKLKDLFSDIAIYI